MSYFAAAEPRAYHLKSHEVIQPHKYSGRKQYYRSCAGLRWTLTAQMTTAENTEKTH